MQLHIATLCIARQAALGVAVCRSYLKDVCVQVLYCVHSTSRLMGWLLTLRMREPEVYSTDKLVFCETLQQLQRYVSRENLPDLPLHVLDKDRKRLAEHRR